MASRIETPTIVVPGGTAIAAPQTTALTLRDAILERIQVRVPPGPSGLVGFAFVHSGQQVIPFRDGQWIIADDENLDWAVEDYPTGNKWSVKAYNIDLYSHTLYLRLHFREFGETVAPTQSAIPVVSLGGAMPE